MTAWLLAAAAVVEAVLLVALWVLWRRARSEVAELQRRLEARRRLPSARDAVRVVSRTAALVREKGVGGALLSSVEELVGWAQVERPDLTALADRDGTITIAFSDIQDSTALNESLGDRAWVRVLSRHEKLVRREVDVCGGRVIKSQGDGFMIAFRAPQDAVACAIRIQRGLVGATRPPMRVRIGIHCGSAVHRDGDLFGRNVAYAARVAGAASGGEILTSDAVRVALSGDAVEWAGAREVEFKGLIGEHRVHAVAWA